MSPAEVAELEAARARLLTADSGVPARRFVYLAAFDGTGNDRNNIPLSGHPFQTNVANLYDQAKASESDGFRVGYFPGVGTGGSHGHRINAGVLPTPTVHQAAEAALQELTRQARDYLRDTTAATSSDLSVSTVGFSRGTATQVVFAQLLHERGLVLPDGTVVAPPGSVPIASMVLIDPVHTFIQGDMSLPPNVLGNVMVFGAKDELRGEFKLADYRADPRVRFTEIAGNHSGIGGGYDLHGTAAVVLEASTAYFHNSGVALGDVPPERRFDPSRPIARYTEVYQIARNGDVLVDGQSRPVPEWSVLRSRGITPVGSSGPAHPKAEQVGLDNSAHPDHALYLRTRTLVHEMDRAHGRAPDERSDNLAAALVVAARNHGMSRIDHLSPSTDAASKIFAVRGDLKSLFKQIASVPTMESLHTPMAQSAAQWPQAMQQFQHHAHDRERAQALDQRNAQQQAGPVMSMQR
ncbi:DUF2235 domain-containing protein [Variovorax sp. J22P240]|uniref:XVIPCD domain-containing protein n=1 Tax=Variovorax sp. J22P240 TaxID=3053514 RepID=UPI0025790988|nr:XVIPCD domain-containing protein [Variovorax sp. J22P240]MDL9998374.1 DUF2235 domain-containing protein [Variovorax sp. J22P240]